MNMLTNDTGWRKFANAAGRWNDRRLAGAVEGYRIDTGKMPLLSSAAKPITSDSSATAN
jgi:hypothetical protein